MFRWCSYCQHLIGEAPPLEDFRVTHGICPICERTVEDYAAGPEEILAKRLLSELEAAGRSGEFSAVATAIQQAIEAGIRPSEVLIGVLHPALARIGALWESGQLTVPEEHRFTAFCVEVIDRLPTVALPQAKPTLLLAPFYESGHELGLRMLQHLAWERSTPCDLMPLGTSGEAILAAALRLRPSLFGISVSLVESIPAALSFCGRIQSELAAETSLALGGQAFRRSPGPQSQSGMRIVRTIDEFLAWIEPIRGGSSSIAMGGRSLAGAG